MAVSLLLGQLDVVGRAAVQERGQQEGGGGVEMRWGVDEEVEGEEAALRGEGAAAVDLTEYLRTEEEMEDMRNIEAEGSAGQGKEGATKHRSNGCHCGRSVE